MHWLLANFLLICLATSIRSIPLGRSANDSQACAENEHFMDCGTACEPTCETPNPAFCTLVCVVGCQCNNGFVRNHQKACVPLNECALATTHPSVSSPAPFGQTTTHPTPNKPNSGNRAAHFDEPEEKEAEEMEIERRARQRTSRGMTKRDTEKEDLTDFFDAMELNFFGNVRGGDPKLQQANELYEYEKPLYKRDSPYNSPASRLPSTVQPQTQPSDSLQTILAATSQPSLSNDAPENGGYNLRAGLVDPLITTSYPTTSQPNAIPTTTRSFPIKFVDPGAPEPMQGSRIMGEPDDGEPEEIEGPGGRKKRSYGGFLAAPVGDDYGHDHDHGSDFGHPGQFRSYYHGLVRPWAIPRWYKSKPFRDIFQGNLASDFIPVDFDRESHSHEHYPHEEYKEKEYEKPNDEYKDYEKSHEYGKPQEYANPEYEKPQEYPKPEYEKPKEEYKEKEYEKPEYKDENKEAYKEIFHSHFDPFFDPFDYYRHRSRVE